MFAESEIREDMGKLRAHIDALISKYGDDFSCILSAGVSMEDAWAGSCLTCGESYLVHQACHGLLENPKFIDEFFNAIYCVLEHSKEDRPEFIKHMLKVSIDSLKDMLIRQTEHYKKYEAEEEADEAVNDLLKQTGFIN